jgi:phosphate starvation-inducible protein PhoH
MSFQRKSGKKGRRGRYSAASSYEADYAWGEEQFEMEDVESLSAPTIIPKNDTQEKYNSLLFNINTKIIFATGPAGTGKTLLACHAGIVGLNEESFEKMIITRPVVSVEEDIGYLPGSIEDKMDPWVRPFMDIFSEYYSQTAIQYMLKEKIIEICPLAYMRGRTFKNSYIVADEMQNSSPTQMKMILTRLGENSKMVITGDLRQHDRKYADNGLKDICSRLEGKNYKRMSIINFTSKDVERSQVVKDVLEVYGDEV